MSRQLGTRMSPPSLPLLQTTIHSLGRGYLGVCTQSDCAPEPARNKVSVQAAAVVGAAVVSSQ